MNKKKKIILPLILGIVSIFIVTIGITYALLRYMREGTTDNTITTGTIQFLYDEKSGYGNGIKISDAMPMSDTLGMKQIGIGKVFNFKITSTTPVKTGIPYQITVKKYDSDLDERYVKIYLAKVDGENEYQVKLANFSETKDIDDVTILKEGLSSYATDEKLVYSGRVPSNTSNYEENFRLKMWIDEDANFSPDVDENGNSVSSTSPLSGKTFKVKVNVYANGTMLSDNDLELEKSTEISKLEIGGTVPTKVSDDSYEVTVSLTNPIVEIETENPYATVKIEKTDENYNVVAMNSNIERLSTNKRIYLDTEFNYFLITIIPEDKNIDSKVIKLKVTVNSDISFQVEKGPYPVLISTGVVISNEISINYSAYAVRRLYKIDDGQWQDYQNESISLDYGDTLYAKEINSKGIESIAKEYTLERPSDMIPEEAYDDNLNSCSNLTENGIYYFIEIDSSMVGKKMFLKLANGWRRDFYFLDEDGNKVPFEFNGSMVEQSTFTNGTIGTFEIIIPEEAVKFGHYNGYTPVYDITPLYIETNVNTVYPTLTSTGMLSPYQDIEINYADGYTKRFYKIDDGQWQTYQGGSIRISYNQTLYVKALNENETRSEEKSYVFPKNIFTTNAYDDDLNSYHLDYINNVYHCVSLDNSVIGKTLSIKVSNPYSRPFYFLDSNGNTVSFVLNGSTVGQANINETVQIVIPEGAVQFGYYHGYVSVYDIRLVD